MTTLIRQRRPARATTLFASVGLGALGAAILPAYGADEPVKGGTLIYATDREPTCLDPHVDGDMPQVFVAQQYTDSLVSQNKDGTIGPWLAKSWTVSEDGKTYTFKLRDDVTFTNGEKFNAAALKANLDHIKNPAPQSPTAGGYIRQYVSTDTPDETTAVVHLSEPYAAFLEVLAQGFLGIQAPSALARPRNENCESPVGSGPFKITKWDRQSEIVFERNPDYNWAPPTADHQGPAYLDKIVWKFIPEPSVRFAALENGDVDVIEAVPPESEEGAEQNADLKLIITDRPGAPTHGALNITRAPFDDIRIREAFVRSADIESALNSVFFGRYKRAPGPLSAPTPFSTADFRSLYDYDPARANQLLDEAGWTKGADGLRQKDGKTLTVHIPIGDFQGPAERSLWEQIQATATEVGFDVQLEPLGFSEWLDRMSKWDYDVLPEYWNTNTADVLRIILSSQFVAPAGSGGYHQNTTGFKDAAFDKLLTDALATQDPEARRKLYYDAQKIVAENFLLVLTFPQSTRLGVYKTAKGVRLEPSLSVTTLYDAWVQK